MSAITQYINNQDGMIEKLTLELEKVSSDLSECRDANAALKAERDEYKKALIQIRDDKSPPADYYNLRISAANILKKHSVDGREA